MISIILKDNTNKLFQEMMFLRDDIELLIWENINTINRTGTPQFQIETHAEGIAEYWEKRGYKRDNALYDKIIIEYNQKNEIPLVRWQ